ncbi:hypothetical protein BD779DRAFT_1201825 [Infundibulicybe gibba]|nr:hypothetical protein BD779DRAFT_1201825 [Infundibulicybe gibba]
MASTDGKSPDVDDPLDSSSNDPSIQPMHSVSYSGMPMHMYPFPPGLLPAQQPPRSKRRQVKNACTNCQKACKKCDDARPCLRCVKYGISEECIDSQRKERKKGIKRGPYKKRDGKGNSVESHDAPTQQGLPVSTSVPSPQTGSPLVGPYIGSVGISPTIYSSYPHPSPAGPKQGESSPAIYPYYLVPPPTQQQHPTHNTQEGSDPQYMPQHQQFFPAFVQYPPVYPPYVTYARHDGQVPLGNHPYPAYGAQMYQKQSQGGSGAMGHGGGRAGEVNDGDTDKSV